jgi:hypothetical protein
MNSNLIRVFSNFDQSKKDIPKLKKLEIKYGCDGLKERNNFLYRNFFKFEMGFALKFGEVKVCF